MEETEESIAYVQEFEEILSRQVSEMPGLEEAALEELRKLEQSSSNQMKVVTESPVATASSDSVVEEKMDIAMPQAPEEPPIVVSDESIMEPIDAEEMQPVAVPAWLFMILHIISNSCDTKIVFLMYFFISL